MVGCKPFRQTQCRTTAGNEIKDKTDELLNTFYETGKNVHMEHVKSKIFLGIVSEGYQLIVLSESYKMIGYTPIQLTSTFKTIMLFA